MGNQVIINISGRCVLQPVLDGCPHAPLVVDSLKQALSKRLLKKGFAIEWSEQTGPHDLWVTITEIEKGNQLLRYLLPFISPAVVVVEGQINLPGKTPTPYHFPAKAQLGLFGGSAKGMLKQCATQAADRIAKMVVKAAK